MLLFTVALKVSKKRPSFQSRNVIVVAGTHTVEGLCLWSCGEAGCRQRRPKR